MKLFVFIAVLLGLQTMASAQTKEGYSLLYTVKQPYHSFNASKYQDTKKGKQKVYGMKFSPSEKKVIIAYDQNPTHIAVYEVGSWKRVGLFEVLGTGVELNHSYFDPEEKNIYLRFERFSTKYKLLEAETGKIKVIECDKTPIGCSYEELHQDAMELYTANRKFFLEVSKLDPSDVFVYIKQVRRP